LARGQDSNQQPFFITALKSNSSQIPRVEARESVSPSREQQLLPIGWPVKIEYTAGHQSAEVIESSSAFFDAGSGIVQLKLTPDYLWS
jgi:hypothetical protein